MRSVYAACLIGMLSLSWSMAFAFDGVKVPANKGTTLGLYLSAKEANTMIIKEKTNFLGMPTIADANIPYLENRPHGFTLVVQIGQSPDEHGINTFL